MKYLLIILFLTSCSKSVYRPYILSLSKEYKIYDVRDTHYILVPKNDTTPKIGVMDALHPYLINLDKLEIKNHD